MAAGKPQAQTKRKHTQRKEKTNKPRYRKRRKANEEQPTTAAP